MSINLDQEISEIQTRTKVAIQGYAGAFHEIAARLHFGEEEMEIKPCNTFEQLVKSVEVGDKATAGLMAIENSLAGSIMFNYQLLHGSNLQVTGEVYLRIKQNLMTLPGTKIGDLEEVHSHYMAIAQCREFFRKHPHIRLVESADTALSAKHIREQNLTKTGAIASTLAAELYGLDIIAPSIETNKKNYTRFLVLHPKEMAVELPDANKVSLCFSVSHEVGGLYKILGVLAAYGVNLTKIQSSPIVGKEWEYLFFVDFIGDKKLGWQQALDAIRPLTTSLRILGVYPEGQHFEY
ncbi:MAG: prephenate dehydratase [Paraglaciecola sp.]|jgi:prephenate dehydratase